MRECAGWSAPLLFSKSPNTGFLDLISIKNGLFQVWHGSNFNPLFTRGKRITISVDLGTHEF